METNEIRNLVRVEMSKTIETLIKTQFTEDQLTDAKLGGAVMDGLISWFAAFCYNAGEEPLVIISELAFMFDSFKNHSTK